MSVALAKVGSSAKFGVVVFKASILDSLWGPLARVGFSAKFCAVVFKASILDSLGGPLAKVGLSTKFGVAVFKASILYSPGGPLAKVGSSTKSGVAVFKASILNSVGGPSARFSFNNNITYYTWQIWALIVEICSCHVGVFWWCFGGLRGCQGGLHLTWLYNANWLLTTLSIQK